MDTFDPLGCRHIAASARSWLLTSTPHKSFYTVVILFNEFQNQRTTGQGARESNSKQWFTTRQKNIVILSKSDLISLFLLFGKKNKNKNKKVLLLFFFFSPIFFNSSIKLDRLKKAKTLFLASRAFWVELHFYFEEREKTEKLYNHASLSGFAYKYLIHHDHLFNFLNLFDLYIFCLWIWSFSIVVFLFGLMENKFLEKFILNLWICYFNINVLQFQNFSLKFWSSDT